MTRRWFSSKECTALEIRKYTSISARQIVSAVTIDDGNVVRTIMARIENIPVAGDKMISFGPDAECIELLFHGADGTTQEVAILQKRFKTPSTGFNSGLNTTESALYSDIDALLFPAVDKVILKTRDVELDFTTFSLTYLGDIASEDAPVSASWVKSRFLLQDRTGQSQVIEITSGQRPPPAHDFEIDKTFFTLLTYETRDRRRLYPGYFQVIRNGASSS